MNKIPTRLNIIIVLITLFLNGIVFIIPLISPSFSVILCVLTIDILILRLTNLHWHIIHEGIHGILHPNAKINELLSRLLSILIFSSFNMVRAGHLLHHRVNRQSIEIDVSETSDRISLKEHSYYYFIILGGHYLFYVFALGFLFFLPRKSIINIGEQVFESQFSHDTKYRDRAINHLKKHIEGKNLLKIRMDFSIALILTTSLGLIYSKHILILIIYISLRALFISYYDNMPHYATETFGNINAARNAYLPRPLAWIFLNFNYHRVHHEYPILPWKHLPDEFQKQSGHYDDNMLSNFFKQLSGKKLQSETRSERK